MIDSRAVIDPGAELDSDVEVGPFAVIGPHVRVGRGSRIGPHAVLDGHTTLGEACQVFSHAAVGTIPQDLKYRGEPTVLEVGARTVIREFVTMNTGTAGGGGVTRVGTDCLFMAYSHVAHDCLLGNHVIMANAATLAGHITVEDWVIVGGLTAVHQFVRVGEHAILGGCSAVVKDVPPYVSASGNRAKLYGLNLTGLKRRGLTPAAILALRGAYRMIFQGEGETVGACLDAVRASPHMEVPEVGRFVEFIAQSERGVTR
ncbi:MAG: acyl-ACP--UDP-N-acetylglucosamine O-acyltransferase [Deferrisomatales bacterium]|nr:acyl-ACP--UDP-N-acetylglucosamine O-acyltransferase [Deferrisomatales bacterium]